MQNSGAWKRKTATQQRKELAPLDSEIKELSAKLILLREYHDAMIPFEEKLPEGYLYKNHYLNKSQFNKMKQEADSMQKYDTELLQLATEELTSQKAIINQDHRWSHL